MADHAKFIGHLLDPSERKLVDTARNFSNDFDELMYQAIDLESMKPQSQTAPLFRSIFRSKSCVGCISSGF